MSIKKHLASMVAHDRWCVAFGHGDKAPRQVDGSPASSTDPSTWTSYEEASLFAELNGWEVGYVFGDGQHFFLDLDCENAINHPWVGQFPGAAVERSLGGTGVHVYGQFAGERPAHSSKRPDHTEFYSDQRFGIITGKDLRGDSSTAFDMRDWLAAHFPPRATANEAWSDEPVPEYTGGWDDDGLIERMCSSKGSAAQAFGGTATARQLWEGDEDALGAVYPSPRGDAFDRSTADQALAGKLAFWTGKDCERMLRLMRRSGLVRDKWDRPGYLEDTIRNAVHNCGSVYDKVPTASTKDVVHQPSTLFEGMVYVTSLDRVYAPVGGRLYSKPQFNHTFADRGPYPLPSGEATWKAWEAFVRSQPGFPRVDQLEFDPTTAEQVYTNEDGLRVANMWQGITTPCRPGDASLFVQHIANLYSQQDFEVVMAYLAALVQYPGRKFGWILVQQGVEGNGKSTITRAITRILGSRYVTQVRPSQLGGRFNGNLSGKLLAVIDDIDKIPPRAMGSIKTLITSTRLEIERKGMESVSESSCVNFIANTNYLDTFPKNTRERRFAVCKSRMQAKEHLPGGEYFDKLHDSIADIGPLHDMLANYRIPDHLNPTRGARRAPSTSFEGEVIEVSRSPLAQEIWEAIQDGTPRFRGGWVSSEGVDLLCAAQHMHETRQAKRQALEELGYEFYREADRGRATRTPSCDTKRSTLWVVKGYQGSRDVEDYEKAQSTARPSSTGNDPHRAFAVPGGGGESPPDSGRLH